MTRALISLFWIYNPILDFPGSMVDKNLSANAGDNGFDPWSGKISHAAQQLSPEATTTEARAPRACALQ